MIPIELLALTNRQAPGFLVYGQAGLKKTFGSHTLPPPILFFDMGEGGTAPLMPWIRRTRKWDDTSWTLVSQEAREKASTLVTIPSEERSHIPPAGLIDVIRFETFEPASWEHFVLVLGSFELVCRYSSIVVDSLQEMSVDVQTFTKGKDGINAYEPMVVKQWAPVQERTAIQLRRSRDYRNHGIFIYLIGSESIDKAYVTDPRSTNKGERIEQPYSTKGTVNVPGQMVNVIPHLVDVMLHARVMNGSVSWICAKESIAPGCAWETKDRYGRLELYQQPNFYAICKQLYGPDGAKEIYKYATKQLEEENA